jgi:hypothetical protein
MRFLSFIWLSFFCFNLIASPSPALQKLFKTHFKKHYESGQCYDNTVGFLRKAVEISNGTFYLVSVENKGFTSFGMVQAEKARDFRLGRTSSEEQNWYHHVFAMDDKGWVFDLDFTHEPNVIHLKDYLEQMFLFEPECDTPIEFRRCVGKENKLSDYEFTLNRATFALEERLDPQQMVLPMAKLLKSSGF